MTDPITQVWAALDGPPVLGTEVDPAPYLVDLDAPGGRLTVARSPGLVHGHPLSWPEPAPAYGTARPGPDRPARKDSNVAPESGEMRGHAKVTGCG